LARGFEEDAGERLHDVRLVHHGDLLASIADRVVEGELENVPAALPRIDPRGHADCVRVVADRDEVLVAHVEAFIVFAHQHQIDVFITSARDQRARGTDVGIELEFFAQAHVRGAVAAADRRFQRAFQRQAGLAYAVQTLRRQRIAHSSDAGGARDLAVPNERRAERIERHQRGRRDFRANAIARDQGRGNRFAGRHDVFSTGDCYLV